jgi:hypothetical protein
MQVVIYTQNVRVWFVPAVAAGSCEKNLTAAVELMGCAGHKLSCLCSSHPHRLSMHAHLSCHTCCNHLPPPGPDSPALTVTSALVFFLHPHPLHVSCFACLACFALFCFVGGPCGTTVSGTAVSGTTSPHTAAGLRWRAWTRASAQAGLFLSLSLSEPAGGGRPTRRPSRPSLRALFLRTPLH